MSRVMTFLQRLVDSGIWEWNRDIAREAETILNEFRGGGLPNTPNQAAVDAQPSAISGMPPSTDSERRVKSEREQMHYIACPAYSKFGGPCICSRLEKE